MRLRVVNIQDVAEKQLCCGCGACAYMSAGQIRMVDTLEHGRRPIQSDTAAPSEASHEALAACPGIAPTHTFDAQSPSYIASLSKAWGPVLEVWEGFARDDAVRFAGSSGGAASALSLYCIEKGGMHGLLHIAARKDVPYLNQTVLSTTRDEILAATGSRYAPASPCDGLQKVEDAPAPCVFIGKPCDVAGTLKARALRPELDRKLGLTIGIFCAGTPSTEGTLLMLEKMGVTDPGAMKSLRYRGMGWPGMATAVTESEGPASPDKSFEMTYQQSWGEILQKHRPWRCSVCVDHTGEFADISVGDPWYQTIPPGEPGKSLVLVRTERGRKILHEAIAAGYLHLETAEPWILEASQKGFPIVRGSVWGRIWTSRLMGAAAPVYRNMPMARFWFGRLSLREKLQSVVGTARRVFSKHLLGRIPVVPYRPPEDHVREKPVLAREMAAQA